MASNDYQNLQEQAESVKRLAKTLLNRDLAEILESENLPKSGVKTVLHSRILSRIDDTIRAPDYEAFDALRIKIQVAANLNTVHALQQRPSHLKFANSPYQAQSSPPRPTITGASMNSQLSHRDMRFTPSPFYEMLEPITVSVDLPVMSLHRHTAHASFYVPQPLGDRFRQDRNLRFMVYCAVPESSKGSAANAIDISFPNQVELKVNDEVVAANLRGIKKKPGTTKPADITGYVQKKPGFRNTVALTYAATDKKFTFRVFMVRKHTVEELVGRIKAAKTISKQSVINEMISKANDPDVEATSIIMSLKCPLSAMRMTLPCRSTICSHNQCFDASSFLQVQEQAPQWSCPICNKVFKFDALAIDLYVQDILGNTSNSVEQVTIEPDGVWRRGGNSDSFKIPEKRKLPDAWETEDLLIIGNGSPADFSLTPQSHAKTPGSSREPSMASTAGTSINGKRSAREVIDLTLSDDEDERPRPVKRQSVNYLQSSPSPFSPTGPPSGFNAFLLGQHQPSQPSYNSPPFQSPGYPPSSFSLGNFGGGS